MERTDFEQWRAKEVARLLALVETERRYYQEIIAALPAGLVVLSPDRFIVSANRAFRRLFGLRIEDLRGKSIEQILRSDRLLERIRDVHVHGIPQPAFFLDVDERQFRIAILPIRNWDDENELETLLMVEDLTGVERMRAAQPGEPAVSVPEPASMAWAAGLPATVWRADAATLAFTAVSDGAEQLLGYTVSHWLDSRQFFAERIHPDDRTATLAFYDAAIARGGDASAEYRAATASGSIVWCRETIRVPAPDSGDRMIAGVITDISRRKQLEEQLLTAERTGAQQGLARRLAHDLNNPLMIVTGYSEELLQSLPQDDPRRSDVEQILAATERISGLTDQLLAFTRRQATPRQPVNVTRALAGMEEKIAHAAGEGVTIEIEPAGAVGALAGLEQLEEVILGLVSAGREDARERSRVTIGCRTDTLNECVATAILQPGMYTVITIRDDGRGLDPEKRPGMFESFLAKDPAAPALARAYGLVREWGGDIAFASEPFRGSTFLIYLPHCEATGEAAPAPVSAVREPPVEETRETILVVDDEVGIRSLVRKILRRERYNVLEAGSAEEALSTASMYEGRIDLLLTDVMLPGATGRRLAEQLGETRPGLKVVYVSGFTDDEAVRAGAFPPGSKFLQKPFTLGALVGKVREALDS
jgi:two-component system cell cycle sensor histidine kinase/response regulator CckA